MMMMVITDGGGRSWWYIVDMQQNVEYAQCLGKREEIVENLGDL